jgi:hypothetical protein
VRADTTEARFVNDSLAVSAQTKPEWAVVHVEIALFWLAVTDAGTQHIVICYQYVTSMLFFCSDFVNLALLYSTAVAKIHLHQEAWTVALGHLTDRLPPGGGLAPAIACT